MSDQTGGPFLLYAIVAGGVVLLGGFVGVVMRYLRAFRTE
jgi:hypothetical protein